MKDNTAILLLIILLLTFFPAVTYTTLRDLIVIGHIKKWRRVKNPFFTKDEPWYMKKRLGYELIADGMFHPQIYVGISTDFITFFAIVSLITLMIAGYITGIMIWLIFIILCAYYTIRLIFFKIYVRVLYKKYKTKQTDQI